jgi:hypothetical protein
MMTEERGGFTQSPKAVFSKIFALGHFWLRKITTDPHILAYVNTSMECLVEM